MPYNNLTGHSNYYKLVLHQTDLILSDNWMILLWDPYLKPLFVDNPYKGAAACLSSSSSIWCWLVVLVLLTSTAQTTIVTASAGGSGLSKMDSSSIESIRYCEASSHHSSTSSSSLLPRSNGSTFNPPTRPKTPCLNFIVWNWNFSFGSIFLTTK